MEILKPGMNLDGHNIGTTWHNYLLPHGLFFVDTGGLAGGMPEVMELATSCDFSDCVLREMAWLRLGSNASMIRGRIPSFGRMAEISNWAPDSPDVVL